MSFQVSCPNCGKQLTARPALVGGNVACPRCSSRFRIEPPLPADSEDPAVFPPPNPNLYPPGAGPPRSAEPPPGGGAPPRARPPRGSSPPPTEAPVAGDDPLPAVRAEPARKRPAQHTARFIERDANATDIKLGADGRLPDLALNAHERRTEAGEGAKSTHPLVLFGVLCFSVIMSVLILMFDEPTAAVSGGKEEARRTLEASFNSWDQAQPPDPEVRDLLARALQAYNRGDFTQEKRLYRQVMNRLNREDAPKYGGFTGDDPTLKQALSELLR